MNERATLKCFEFGPGNLGPIGKFCGEVCLHKHSVYNYYFGEGRGNISNDPGYNMMRVGAVIGH